MHEISHEAFKAERTYNVAKDWAINDIMNKDDYIYRGGNDDVVRKAGCDMWKFETWLSKCPVTIYKREDCANGWIEMHFIIDDETNEMKIDRIVGGNRIKRSSDLRRQLLGFRPTRMSETLIKLLRGKIVDNKNHPHTNGGVT